MKLTREKITSLLFGKISLLRSLPGGGYNSIKLLFGKISLLRSLSGDGYNSIKLLFDNILLFIHPQKNECDLNCRISSEKRVKITRLDAVHSYFSSVYNTLISIVCAFSLEVLFSQSYSLLDINVSYPLRLIVLLKIVIMFLMISTVWHHYVMNNGYIFWTIKTKDILLPFLWSVTLILPSYFICPLYNETYYFTIFLHLNYALGSWAYYNNINNVIECKGTLLEGFQEKYDEKYGCYDKRTGFSNCLWKAIYDFQIRMLRISKFSIVLCFFSSMYMSFSLPNDNLITMFIYAFQVISLWIHLSQNLNKFIGIKMECIEN